MWRGTCCTAPTTSGFTPSTATRIATVTATTYVDSPARAPGGYFYRVIAEDAAGNVERGVTGGRRARRWRTPRADGRDDGAGGRRDRAWVGVGDRVREPTTSASPACSSGSTAPISALRTPARRTRSAGTRTAATAGAHTLTRGRAGRGGQPQHRGGVAVTVDNTRARRARRRSPPMAFDEATGTAVTDATGRAHTGTISGATRTTTGKTGARVSFDGVNDSVSDRRRQRPRPDDRHDARGVGQPDQQQQLAHRDHQGTPGDLTYALYSGGATSADCEHHHRRRDRLRRSDRARRLGPAAEHLDASRRHLRRRRRCASTADGTQIRQRQPSRLHEHRHRRAEASAATAIWGEWFAGRLDDVRVYNTALTAAQIQTDMNTPSGGCRRRIRPRRRCRAGWRRRARSVRCRLRWDASTDNVGVARYVVHRSATSGFTPTTATRIATVTATTYVDSPLAPGSYYYRVIAEDAAGNASAASPEVAGTSLTDTVAPSVPGGVAATGSLGQVSVRWDASTDNVGVARYVLHRSATSGFTPSTATRIATVTATTYVDSPLAAGRATSTA